MAFSDCYKISVCISFLVLSSFFSPLYGGSQFSGFVGTEVQYFPQSPLHDDQPYVNTSLVAEPEWAYELGAHQFVFKPFGRFDQSDVNRSHVDIRELMYSYAVGNLEWKAGVGKVFWGVTEGLHLVDIINQTDLVESLDQDEKLGQPMLAASWSTNYGLWDAFILPGFRERTFVGNKGRFRFPVRVTDDTAYESDQEDRHVDWALRWSSSFSVVDLGISHFSGTGRIPYFDLVNNEFQPFYPQIQQTGIDAQATIGSWLWKLEAISQQNSREDFMGADVGFEYSFYTVFGTNADVGVLAEYLYDERGKQGINPFDNELFVGSRVALNDVDGTEFLVGGMFDLENDAWFASVEASRRFGNHWRLTGDLRVLGYVPPTDFFYGIRRDGGVSLQLECYF